MSSKMQLIYSAAMWRMKVLKYQRGCSWNLRVYNNTMERHFSSSPTSMISLVHTMLVIMLVVLQMVTQEQLATFVHASEDYAS